MGNDPEALTWVVNDGDVFLGSWGDGPRTAQEVEGVIGIEGALEIEGQMQIQQRDSGGGTELGAFFFAGQLPSGIGG